MTTPEKRPQNDARAQSETARRKAREAEALRANLRRRKDQARSRDADKPDAEEKP